MEPSRTGRWMILAGALAAGLAALTRTFFLLNDFDAEGLLLTNSRALLITVIFSLGVTALLWAMALRLLHRPGTEDCFPQTGGWLLAKLLCAIALFFGALVTILDGTDPGDPAQLPAAAGGLAAGLCMGAAALWGSRLGKGRFWVRLIPALYAGVTLILRFRDWSHDPLVIHIAPLLLAFVCSLLTLTLLTGFPLNAGHRRSTPLFGLLAMVFCAMALPDYALGFRTGLGDLLVLVGLAGWSAVAALEILTDQEPD